MLSKFSVKKPYTVVVAVVLVLILGFVSFGNMTADLFPDINFPYAVVMTTYAGASPSEVEEQVSRPVEEAMATVSNIEEIQSVSSENMSMVVLQFGQSANMDSVTLEMREKLDQIGSTWPDEVANPVIMKINPDMMPVMVAAVEKDGLTDVQITDLVEKEILSGVESLEGVASASASGEVEQSVQVILRQEKIDQMNQKIQDALNGKFDEAQEELDAGKEELDAARSELENGKAQLESGKAQMNGQLSQAKDQLGDKQMEMLQSEADIDSNLELIEEKLDLIQDSEKELDEKEAELKKLQEALDTLPQTKAELQAKEQEQLAQEARLKSLADTGAVASYTEAEQKLAELSGQMKQLTEEIRMLEEQLKDPGLTEEQREEIREKLQSAGEQKAQLQPSLDQQSQAVEGLKESFAAAGITEISQKALAAKTAENKAALAATRTALEGISDLEEHFSKYQQEVSDGLAQIASGREQLEAGKTQLTEARDQLAAAKQQIQAGKITLQQALSQLNSQEITASIQMATAEIKLETGSQGIESGLAQLEEGQKTLDEQKEAALSGADLGDKITSSMITQILTAQNFSMPAGYVTEEGIQYLVRVGDKFTSTEEMEDLVLFDMGIEGLDPIRLSDVADVAVTDNSDEVYARINGNPGVLLTIQKQTGYATGEVSDRLKEYFSEVSEKDPDLHVTMLMDQGIYIDLVVDSVLENLVYGAVLAILILILFLKDLRPTFIVACSIPISVVAAIVLMYFSGVTLNIISLSGLALGVGMLVDNSIVVIENIYRLRGLKVPVKKACIDGARQMAGAITSSTLTTVCVFLPIVFTKGITRQLFVDMGLTIAYSLLASLAVALTVVPMLSSGLMRRPMQKKHVFLDRVTALYGKVMERVLQIKPVVLIGAVLLLGLSVAAALSKGTAFMPEMESTQTSVTLQMPEGTSVKEAGETADLLMSRIREIPDVTDVGAMTGSSSLTGAGGGNGESVSMYVLLKEKRELTNEELTQEILAGAEGLDCEIQVANSSMDMSALGGSGLSIQIKGKEMDTLQKIAGEVADLVEQVEGTAEVSDGMQKTTGELRLVVDKEKASEHNLTVAQVYQQIAAAMASGKIATTLSTESRDYPVVIIDEEQEDYTREDIRGLTITATNAAGEEEEIPVEELVNFEDAEGLSSIQRKGQSRYINVTAAIQDGYNVGLVGEKVEKALEGYELPEGYSIEMAGEDATISEAMTELMKMLGLAVVFIYLIMVAQFQSLLSPFIVMFTLPLAFTGGFLGLIIAGQEVSIIAMVGFVMLSGIIVNNGIVLVDYINQLREEGMEKRAAIIEAGKTRMRPILMTALTTILGLSTMSAGVGMGSEMVQPMAVVTIGGLLYGTFLTLFVIPCVYDLLNRKNYKKFLEGEEDGEE